GIVVGAISLHDRLRRVNVARRARSAGNLVEIGLFAEKFSAGVAEHQIPSRFGFTRITIKVWSSNRSVLNRSRSAKTSCTTCFGSRSQQRLTTRARPLRPYSSPALPIWSE